MYKTKITLAFISLLFFLFLSWNCTKIDTTSIGSSLIPAVDNVNTFETFLDVAANTIDTNNCTSIIVSEDHALGIINNDPIFGKSAATLYTELEPSVFPFNFLGTKANRKLDSVVLILSYKSTFGDSTVAQKVDVFEINPTGSPTFKPDTSSCKFYDYVRTVLGSKIYKPVNLKDTIKAFQDTTATRQL